MNYTIGELGRQFGLSRSTLIYYHKQGLLVPSGRTAKNYRCYTQKDYQQLEKIMAFRASGMPLKDIARLLVSNKNSEQIQLLNAQLQQITLEIQRLKKQQNTTIMLLQEKGITQGKRVIDKQQWISLLSSAGLTEQDMWLWHHNFEQRMPEAHQAFLESLDIAPDEIKQIRQRSQQFTLLGENA